MREEEKGERGERRVKHVGMDIQHKQGQGDPLKYN